MENDGTRGHLLRSLEHLRLLCSARGSRPVPVFVHVPEQGPQAPGSGYQVLAATVRAFHCRSHRLPPADRQWGVVCPERRFLGDADPVTRNFLEDWPNVLNYLVVCPAYVVLGLCFLFHCPSLRGSLARTGLVRLLDVQEFSSHLTPQKGAVIGGVVLLASFGSISYFASELERYNFLFWFQRLTPNLDRVLSTHGYYYLLTNVFLNLLVVLVIVAHAELFSVASKLGEAMKAQACRSEPPPGVLLDKAAVIKLFQPFTSLYVLSKVLVVVFIVNMYTWKAQKPGFTGTLDFTIVLLALLGVAAVSYPRYHLQYWLFKLWQRGDVPEYPDIRSPIAAGLASIADILILGGAMTNLVAYVLEKSGISLKLF